MKSWLTAEMTYQLNYGVDRGKKMKTWQEILNIAWEDVKDEYGPQSQVVVSTFEALGQIDWFKRIGDPKPATIVDISSWQEAINPLISNETKAYGPNGHLLKPSLICIGITESEEYGELWQLAREDAFDYCNVRPYIPKALNTDEKDFIDEYIYEFVSFLLAEIIGSNTTNSTYFREMLSWFWMGHFPCGWNGNWPEGHMKVY